MYNHTCLTAIALLFLFVQLQKVLPCFEICLLPYTFYTCCIDSMCVPIHLTCSEQLSVGVQAIVIPQLSGTLEQRNYNFQYIRTNCSKSISEDNIQYSGSPYPSNTVNSEPLNALIKVSSFHGVSWDWSSVLIRGMSLIWGCTLCGIPL